MNEYTSIRFEITSTCNINCKYCHNSEHAFKSDDMTSEEIMDIITEMKKRYPIKKILLTGGEPLLNRNILEIIKHITKLGIKTDMVTNGKLLTKDLIHKLEDAGLKRMRVSIDGIDAAHNFYRIGSDANILWDLCDYMKKNTNLNVVIHTVCSNHNVEELNDIYQKILKLKLDRWRVFDVGYSGSAVKNISDLDISRYYTKFVDKVECIVKHYIKNGIEKKLDIEINGIFKTNLLNLNQSIYCETSNEELLRALLDKSPCNYISHQTTVRSNGIATLCQYFHNPIEVYKVERSNITTTKYFPVETKIKLNDIKHCVECKYVLVCNSGCRSKAEFLTKSIYNPDPVFCVLLPLMYEKIIPLLPKHTQKIFNKLINGEVEPRYTALDLKHFMEESIQNETD
ncbi:MAG: radical SAM protein [Bacilli bacterium]